MTALVHTATTGAMRMTIQRSLDWMERRSVRRRLLGWVVAATLSLAGAGFAPTLAHGLVTVRIMTSDAVPGGSVPLAVSVEREEGDGAIATAQVDIIYAADQLMLGGTCSDDGAPCESNEECDGGTCELFCEKAGHLEQQSFFATFPTFQNVELGERRVRLAVLAPIAIPPLPTFDDGIVAMCVFDVRSDAELGPIRLRANRLEVGDEEGDQREAVVVIDAGSIVGSLPTPTVTPTAESTPTATDTVVPTQTETPTEGVATATPSSTNTQAPPPTVTHTVPIVPTATGVPHTPASTATPTSIPATATLVPTNTVVVVPSTATPVPTQQPFPTPRTIRTDDDGCAIPVRNSGSSHSGLLLLLAGLSGIVCARRRFR